ncbi:MAG: tetratricopeptide repeat protein [Leptolyngbyaceae cyanobacterium RM1_406_9]|nr:tetratricopeptide repeat protein [Leptolyngbyaceae cyanobacterium RM1_406_9]
MRQAEICHEAQPKSSKRWIIFGIGLPLTTALLLLTQSNVISRIEAFSNRFSNPLDEPYRYPFTGALTEEYSPTALVQQEIAFYQQRIRQNPQGGLERASLAVSYLQMARATGEGSWYLLAEQTAQQSLANLPFDNVDALLVMARVAEARHDFAGALRLVEQIGGDRDAIAIQVTANLAMGNLSAASQAVDELVAQFPSINSLTLKALVRAAKGKDQEALETFQQALQTEEVGEISSSARTRVLLGRFHYERGELEMAEALYREALRISPAYPLALINLAQLEIRQGDYRAADRHYAQVTASSRGTLRVFDPTVLRGRARIHQLQGNQSKAEELWAEAEIQLRQSITDTSKETVTAFGHERDLAKLLLERGRSQDISEAVVLMRSQIQSRRDADTLDTFAWALSRSGEWQEAQQAIQEALDQGIRDAGIYDRAGAIEQALGNDARAVEDFQKVKEIDPEFGERAREALGLGAGLGS